MSAPSLIVPILSLLAAGCVGLPDTSNRVWPVKTEERTAGGGRSLSVLGPLIKEEERGDAREMALRPIWRWIEEGERVRLELLWPLVTYEREPGREMLRILPVFSDRRLTDEETGREDRDFFLFPFLFGGSDSDEGDYLLFFPIWGTTRDLFGSEEIRWRFFPLFVSTRDRDYESHSVLWPLIGWGGGGGRSMFRILPFYSSRETEGKSYRRSVLWPLLTWGKDGLDTDHPSSSFLLFPLYGRTSSGTSSATTVLYPFFSYARSEGGYREANLFWPIFRTMTAPDRSAFRIWPFFGRSEFRDGDGGLRRREEYWLWPFFAREVSRSPAGTHETFQFVPFYRRSRHVDRDGALLGEEIRLWPVYREETAADGSYRARVLAPIPFSNWDAFEAHWSWLYTLLDYREVPGRGESLDLLFGLFQHRADRDGSYTGIPLLLEHAKKGREEKLHLLKGLFGWERAAEGSGVRLLWFLRIPL